MEAKFYEGLSREKYLAASNQARFSLHVGFSNGVIICSIAKLQFQVFIDDHLRFLQPRPKDNAVLPMKPNEMNQRWDR